MEEKKLGFEFCERYDDSGEKYFVAKARPLGLTAYGNTYEEAISKLKTIFSMLVEVKFQAFKGE